MADRGSRLSGAGIKPVPMKLFATWEVEKSSPNCIPRLCSLTLSRLVIKKPLESELTSVILAVKMMNSKRVLRSNEIIMPPTGLLDTELDLSFSLQYPHFLKRDVNKLQVMVQRRKKYKNRTILGYKTLATGQLNMGQVLQKSVDRELCLFTEIKERSVMVAQVEMLSLSSQPVDHDENGRRKLPGTDLDRSPDVDLTDDDDVPDDPEDWSNDDMSDSEPNPDDMRHKSGRFSQPAITRQRNIKQKFISLLRRFKISDDVLDSEQDPDLADQDSRHQEIEDLIDELEDLSDSGPEMDTISVVSTPKPKLRPFFTGRGSGLDILDVPKDSGGLSDDSSKKYDSDNQLPRKVLLDQLVSVLSTPDDTLPESFILVNSCEWQGQVLAPLLQEPQFRVISTCSSGDLKAVVSFIVSKIQKFCNSNSKAPQPVKIAVAGGDGYINTLVRPYVDQFSAKSHDWQSYIKFLYIPLGSSNLGRQLAELDPGYCATFQDTIWKDAFDKSDNQKPDLSEIVTKIARYIKNASYTVQLPIAEALVTKKKKVPTATLR